MTDDFDWEGECRGLGYMILDIAASYRQAKSALGGDSELLASRITSYESYAKGPLAEKIGPRHAGGGGVKADAEVTVLLRWIEVQEEGIRRSSATAETHGAFMAFQALRAKIVELWPEEGRE